MSKMMIQTCHLCKTYYNGDVATEVLKGIDLDVMEGEFCAIMGESGSGKSTLLHIMGTLDTPTGGSLAVLGQDTASMSEKGTALLRRKSIGFIFQSFYLIPGLSVKENIMMPNLLDRQKVDSGYLDTLMETVGLSHRKSHRPFQLSGGEQQRAAVARALANRPAILLADEPTGNLDSRNSEQILSLLHRINREKNVTIVMVTHSKELARKCGRIIQVKDGMLI